MNRYVLDASTALSWCFADEEAAALPPDSRAVVPCLWPLEVANGLLSGERRGRISQVQARRVWDALWTALAVEVDHADGVLLAVWPLARDEALSVYDAAYLELAMRGGVPLATRDAKLAAAARNRGVAVLSDGFHAPQP